MFHLFDDIPTPQLTARSFDTKTLSLIDYHLKQHTDLCDQFGSRYHNNLAVWADGFAVTPQKPHDNFCFWLKTGEVLTRYTGSGNQTLNSTLRSKFNESGFSYDLDSCAVDFFQAIQFAPTYEGVLYRGVKNQREITYVPNMTITWEQVTSLSVDVKVAQGFTGFANQKRAVIFEVTNAYGYIIAPYSQYKNEESEIICLPCKLCVNSVTKKEIVSQYGASEGFYTIVNVTIIDQLPVAFQTAKYIQ